MFLDALSYITPSHIYMLILVCKCNEPVQAVTHSSSLCLCDSTMVAAVRSLLGR